MHFFSSSSSKVSSSLDSWSKSVRAFKLSLNVISFSPELVSRSKENVGERSGPISKLMLANSTSENILDRLHIIFGLVSSIPGLAKGGGATGSILVLVMGLEDLEGLGACKG